MGRLREFIVGTAFRACGVPVRHKGALRTDLDLIFEDGDGGYSLKAILKGGSTRLVNVMGAEPRPDRWKTSTVFLVSRLGIVYADPAVEWWAINRDSCVRPTKDALQVDRRCIETYASSNSEWVIPCRLPDERDREQRTHPARTASADVAAQVLYHYPLLFSELPGLRPWEEVAWGRDR